MHNVTDVNTFTSPVTVLDDGDPVAASQTQPTIQALANRTFYNNNLIGNALGMDVTATAGGTTTLSSSSHERQAFTGSSNQNLVLPDETTLPIGKTFFIANYSTGTITVKDSGGSTLFTIPPRIVTLKALVAAVVSFSASIATGNWRYEFQTPGHLQGTATNDAAAAGEVGEVVSANIASTNLGASSGSVSTAFTLSAGAWRISCSAFWDIQSLTWGGVFADAKVSMNVILASGGSIVTSPDANGQLEIGSPVLLENSNLNLVFPAYTFEISTSKHYLFNASASRNSDGSTPNGGTCNFRSWLRAERAR